MAKIYLDLNDFVTLSEKHSVFGSTGTNDRVLISNSALGTVVDGKTEILQFSGKFSDYQFAVTGSSLVVAYNGSSLVTIAIQSDYNGTALKFSDIDTTATLAANNSANLGKATLTTSLKSYTNAQLDGTPPEANGTTAPWTLVMKTTNYYSNILVSNGTDIGTELIFNNDYDRFYNATLSQDGNSSFYTKYDSTANKNQLWTVTGNNLTPTKLANVSSNDLGTSYALGSYDLFVSGGNLIATDGTTAKTFSTNFYGDILQVDTSSNTIWHTINTAPYGTELYKTILTDSGFTTSMVKDIYPGSNSGTGSSSYNSLLTADGKLIFGANDGVTGYEAWVSDGTEVGTFSLDSYKGSGTSGPSQFTDLNGKVVMNASAYDGTTLSGRELVITDGTTVGTKVLDVYFGNYHQSDPTILGTINDKLYFTATDAAGLGLFSTDGDTFSKLVTISDSNAQMLGYTANKAYFAITDATHGKELWAADLTAETPSLTLVKDILAGKASGFINGLNNNLIGDSILFEAYNILGTSSALYISDGTDAGTVQLSANLPTDKAIIGNKVFFANSAGVYEVDTSAATVRATQIQAGDFSVSQYSTIDKLQSDSDQAFFLGADEKLYASTGTNAIELASNVDQFKVVAEDAIYLIATNSSNVASLWYSDGTASGTRYIEDLSMSASSYDLANAVAMINTNLKATKFNDSLSGTSANDVINALAGNDMIYGLSGNDTLNGGAGNDTMFGGSGNDTYYVDNKADKVFETTTTTSATDAGGTDTVNSSISYTLGSFVENLILAGAGKINGTGNSLNNSITGNSTHNTLNGGAGNDTLNGGAGNDMLIGGLGKDILTGGAGKDSFRFDTKPSSSDVDTITDFNVKDDTIQLENSILTAFGSATGKMHISQFRANTTGKAQDGNDYVVYNKTTGEIYYDADGNGAGASVQIALIGKSLALTNADFVLV